MALLPANPGEALWIGGKAGQNHYNVGIGQGTSGGNNHTDFGQSAIEDGYVDANKFFLNAEGNVVFRINASAGRTSTNTAHPRSELRELLLNGSTKAAWDGRSGVHYAKGRCRVIEVTNNRPWICFAQIHGSDGSPITSDLLRLQTEGNTGATTGLSIVSRRSPVSGGEEIRTVLRTGYDVGEWFSWEIRCEGGRVKVLLDGQEVLNVSDLQQNLNYFKAGCYLQDNVEKGASSSSWGAVEYERGSFVTWHTGTPNPTAPVFTGGTDPGGGAGGGDGTPDVQAPTVPQGGVAVRGNTQLALSWTASTDNVGVDHYNIFRFAPGGGGGGAQFTVGKTSSGSETTLSSGDKIAASRHVATQSGTLTEGRFRAWLDSSGSTSSRMLVYADSSGAPGALLATSDQITISTTSEGTRTYLFTSSNRIALTAGTAYWVAVAWDDPGTPSITYSRSGTSEGRVESTATYGTPPNPFGTISGEFGGPIDAWLIAVTGTVGSGSTTTSSFGKTSNGTGSTASSTDRVAASLFTATEDGTLTAGHARCWMSAGSTTVRMVVCSNVAGAPGTFLAVSDALTVSSTTEAVRNFVFSGANQIAIVDGTSYWIGLAWDDPGTDSLTYSRDATPGLRVETGTFTFPPSQGGSWGTPSTGLAGPIDAYVDVSSASSGAGYVLDGTSATPSYTDTGLTNGTEYSYVITAVDAAGNESAQSSVIKGTPGPPDTTPPSVPTGLAAVPGDGKVSLTWNASTDADTGMLRYTVYVDGVLHTQVDATAALALVVSGLTNGQQRSFRVSATDRSLNESALSSAVTATPSAPPVLGVSLLPAALNRAKVEVAVAWGADLTADESTWTWTDITSDVRHDPGLSTSLGRNDESSTSNPATLSLVLDNRSGDYSIGGRSRRWPNVRRGTPVRVRIDPGDGAGGRIVLQGAADGWTPGWDTLTGKIPVVALSVSGTLRRLSQGQAPVQAVYRRATAANTTVRAYWPLEEGQSATYGAPLRGGSRFAVTGSPDWAADESFFCSAPLPNLAGAKLDATVNTYSPATANQVRWLMHLPDGGLPDGTVIAHITMSGTVGRWDLTYEIVEDGTHCLALYRYLSAGGARLGTPTVVSFGATFLGGFTGRVSLEVSQSGGNIAWTFSLTPAVYRSTSVFLSDTISSQTCGRVTRIELNPHQAEVQLVVGHVTVENAITSPFEDVVELAAFEAEFPTSANSRLVRLCRENGIPLQRFSGGGTVGDLERMGPQLSAPLLDLLRECETADQGQLWDGRSAGLQFTTRRRRELGNLTLTVNAAAGELADGFAPVDDDQRTRNRMQVTRLHGVTVTREVTTGPLGTATIGVYDDSLTVNNRNDSMASPYAWWLLGLGTVEGYRYPSVTVDLAASPHLAGKVLDVIPGDRIDITNLDTTLAGFPVPTVSLVVEGIAHEISPRTWRVTFRCSPAAPWMVGRVAAASGDTSDMVLRCDTDGSTLNAAAAVGATSISVASTGVRWTTTADDYPLWLSVGGLRVRATACSGASSPQTMTIDALPAAKAAGAPVRLWEPRRIGLG